MMMNFAIMQEQKINNGKIYSNGGRVINYVCISDNFKKSRDSIINIIKSLKLERWFF